MPDVPRPRIAVFAGPLATLLNTPPLVTSHAARSTYGLSPLGTRDRPVQRFDTLRAQYLAAPVTVYVRQFSAHPLESDAAHLYAPPDGYVDTSGAFHAERTSLDDIPAYQVTLRPDDGLFLLPYMARQVSGQAWEDDCANAAAPANECRQPFYPEASRLFEEIDRFGIGRSGDVNLLSSRAEFDFFRAAPPAGYRHGQSDCAPPESVGGRMPPEEAGEDYFPYRPFRYARQPPLKTLAHITNAVHRAMISGSYAGAIWIEGTAQIEETAYWLDLFIDAEQPIVATASQRMHGELGNDGDRNVVDAVDYIASRVWSQPDNLIDRVGVVLVQDQQIFSAREVQKADARPGGFTHSGGAGGVIGTFAENGPQLTFVPNRRHTCTSLVNITHMPEHVRGLGRFDGQKIGEDVQVKDARGELLETALPCVTIVKMASFLQQTSSGDMHDEVEIISRIQANLQAAPLAGFVGEGQAPYGVLNASMDAALKHAVFSGMPVVKVGRGNSAGFTQPRFPFLGGGNLTATKARLLLMACLLRFGSLPPAADANQPSVVEIESTRSALAAYQAVFDTH